MPIIIEALDDQFSPLPIVDEILLHDNPSKSISPGQELLLVADEIE